MVLSIHLIRYIDQLVTSQIKISTLSTHLVSNSTSHGRKICCHFRLWTSLICTLFLLHLRHEQSWSSGDLMAVGDNKPPWLAVLNRIVDDIRGGVVVDSFVGGDHVAGLLGVSFDSLLHWAAVSGAPVVVPDSQMPIWIRTDTQILKIYRPTCTSDLGCSWPISSRTSSTWIHHPWSPPRTSSWMQPETLLPRFLAPMPRFCFFRNKSYKKHTSHI